MRPGLNILSGYQIDVLFKPGLIRPGLNINQV